MINFIDEICQFSDAFKNRRPNSGKKISAKIMVDLIYKPLKCAALKVQVQQFSKGNCS